MNIGFQRHQPQYIVPFALEDLDGNIRDISEWSEQRILINFWATWCAPCRREMPMLQTLHLNQQEHGIQIIGIAVDQNELARDFINDPEAIEAGLGYEECNEIMIHDSTKYDENDNPKEPDSLIRMINKYFFLSKEELDYDKMKCKFIA